MSQRTASLKINGLPSTSKVLLMLFPGTIRRIIWSSACLVGLLWFVAGPWPRSWATASIWKRATEASNAERWAALESIDRQSGISSSSLEVGVSTVDLTARMREFFGSAGTEHLSLAGHGKRAFTRGNSGVADPLFAKALFIDNGPCRALILSADLLLFNRRLAEGTLAELARRGISFRRDEVLFSATHTHSAYAGYTDRWVEVPSVGFYRPEISNVLIQALADACEASIRNTRPAEIAFASADLSNEHLVVNRIDKNSPTNDLLDVVILRESPTGRLIASVTIFSPHATCRPRRDESVSADYPGAVCRHVELNTSAPSLFLAGSVGSMGPADLGPPRENWIELMGARIGSHAVDLINARRSAQSEIDIAGASITLTLPTAEIKLGESLRLSPVLSRFLVPAETTVHGLRLGRHLFLSMPADFSGELAEEIRNRTPGLTTIVTSFGGDYVGYIIPKRYADLPTYEARSASILGPDADTFFTSAADRLIHHLAPVDPRDYPPPPINTKPYPIRVSAN